jgi:hypothetical protein
MEEAHTHNPEDWNPPPHVEFTSEPGCSDPSGREFLPGWRFPLHYACPEGDYVWPFIDADDSVPPCPNHRLVLKLHRAESTDVGISD